MKPIACITLILALLLPAQARALETACARNVVIYFDASWSMVRNKVFTRMLERLKAVLEDPSLIRSGDQVWLNVFIDSSKPLERIANGRFLAGESRDEAVQQVQDLIHEIETAKNPKALRSTIEEQLQVNTNRHNVFSVLIPSITTDIKRIGSLSQEKNLAIVFSDFIYDEPEDTQGNNSAAIQKMRREEIGRLEKALPPFNELLKQERYLFVMAKEDAPGGAADKGIDVSRYFERLIDRNLWAVIEPQTTVDAFVQDLAKKTRGRPAIPADTVRLVRDNESNVLLEFTVENPNCGVMEIQEVSLTAITDAQGERLAPGGTFEMRLSLPRFGRESARIKIMDAMQAKRVLKSKDLDKDFSTMISLRSGGEYLPGIEIRGIRLSPDILTGSAKLSIKNAILVNHLHLPVLDVCLSPTRVHVRLQGQASIPKPLSMKIDSAKLSGLALTPLGDPPVLEAPEGGRAEDMVAVYTLEASGAALDLVKSDMRQGRLRLDMDWAAEGEGAEFLPQTKGAADFEITKANIRDYEPLEWVLVAVIFVTSFLAQRFFKWIKKS